MTQILIALEVPKEVAEWLAPDLIDEIGAILEELEIDVVQSNLHLV